MAATRRKRRAKEPNPYRKHKTHGFGYTVIDGRQHRWPGKFDSIESREAYENYRREWFLNHKAAITNVVGTSHVDTMAEVCARYWDHLVEQHEAQPRRKAEHEHIKRELVLIGERFGSLHPSLFGAEQLREFQRYYCDRTWQGKHLQPETINQKIGRIKTFVRWAEGEHLMPEGSWGKLQAVPKVDARQAKRDARQPRKSVPDSISMLTLEHVARIPRALLMLIRNTGMRPSEACMIRLCDIREETHDGIDGWVYYPVEHKTKWLGKDRKVVLNAAARDVLAPFVEGLDTDDDRYLFSPKEAEAERLEERRANRKTALNQGNRKGTNKKRRPKRKPGDHYKEDSLRRAVHRAVENSVPDSVKGKRKREAWLERNKWCPYQLRHTRTTEIWQKTNRVDLLMAVLGGSREAALDYIDQLQSESLGELLRLDEDVA